MPFFFYGIWFTYFERLQSSFRAIYVMISIDFLRIVKQQNKHKPYLGSYQPWQNMMKYGRSLGMVHGSQGLLTLLMHDFHIFRQQRPGGVRQSSHRFRIWITDLPTRLPLQEDWENGAESVGFATRFPESWVSYRHRLKSLQCYAFPGYLLFWYFFGISWPSSNELLNVSLGFFGIL